MRTGPRCETIVWKPQVLHRLKMWVGVRHYKWLPFFLPLAPSLPPCLSLYLSLPHSLSLSLTLSYSLLLSLSLSLTLSLSLSLSLSWNPYPRHPSGHECSLSNSRPPSLSLSLSPSLPFCLSLPPRSVYSMHTHARLHVLTCIGSRQYMITFGSLEGVHAKPIQWPVYADIPELYPVGGSKSSGAGTTSPCKT